MAYVYIWKKPDGTPFYVGIGVTKVRWNPRSRNGYRNPHCSHTVRKYGAANIIVSTIEDLSWEDACRLEQTLITWYGRSDQETGILTNQTDGGDGALNPPDLVKQKRSETMKRLNADPDFRAKRIARLKESSENISIGVIRSMEARLKTVYSPEVQAKLHKPKTEEHKAKISAAKTGKPRRKLIS